MSDSKPTGEPEREAGKGRKEEHTAPPGGEPEEESAGEAEGAAGEDKEDNRAKEDKEDTEDKGAKEDTEDTEDKNAFGAFVDGTTRIAKGMGEAFKGVAHVLGGRDHVVMARVNAESLKHIDQLVDAGIFRSRSESTAYLIARGIESDAALFDTVEGRVGEINRLRDELRRMVAFDDDNEETAGED